MKPKKSELNSIFIMSQWQCQGYSSKFLPGNGLDPAVQSAVAAAEPAVPSTKGVAQPGNGGGCDVKQRECPTKSGSPKTPH